MHYKLLRISKNLKSRQVASGIGVSPSYVSRFETGSYDWDHVLIRRYKNFINNN
ncbi:helix-turn-helix domain-containing protein [Paenibacillus albidus]|uniref:helix-turn-helix domain-containing protein n=1 Tax=Paenibacillus albidus TaxID=2041023 RepID=UPI0035CF07B7